MNAASSRVFLIRLVGALLSYVLFGCGAGRELTVPANTKHQAWVSSGGEMFRDSHNPWWVLNTTDVSYCVMIDEPGISAPKANILDLVKAGFQYWKREFSRTNALFDIPDLPVAFRFNGLGIATQNFTEVPCSGAEDLRFQFGLATLTEEQRAYLSNAQSLVGVSVRTSYDEMKLKGRGFVYIASDRGPGRRDSGPELAQDPWQKKLPLLLAITHELGHVFGIPHVGEKYTMMSAEFPETLMSKAFAPFLALSRIDDFETDFGHYFVPPQEFSVCSDLSSSAKSFLELPAESAGLSLSIKAAPKEIQLRHFAADSQKTEYAGVITDLVISPTTSPIGGVMVVLNPQQTVFKLKTDTFSILPGPHFLGGTVTGTLRLQSGIAKPVFLTIAPGRLEIMVQLEGKFATLLSSSSSKSCALKTRP